MQRRTFFGAVGAALAAGGASLAQKAPPPAPKGRLKQGLWKVNFGAGSPLSFDEMCAMAARLGLKGFDIIPAQDWPTLRKYGLDPLMVGPGKTDYLTGLIHPQAHDQVMAGIGVQIDLCAASNVRRIGLTAGQRRGMAYATAADNCVEICQRLAPHLEAKGVVLCIENVNDRRGADADLAREDMVFGHWDWGLEVVERVASPNVKLLCDIYHLQIMDGDIIYRLQRDIKHIAHVHVAGVPQRKEIDERQELNFRSVARTLADLGYDGYVCHEWRLTPGADPARSIAECVAIMDA
jgi:hydroxypyruvate isomerase